MRKWLTICLLAVLLLPMVAGVSPAMAATGDPVLINEVLASHSSTDDTEFVELFGTPGYSLSGLSLIVVEGDAFGPGTIDRRFDFKPFHKIGPNGFFLFGNCGGLPDEYGATPDASLFTNYFENSSLTVALVETASISGGSVSGSEIVLDAVALSDGDAGDTFYFGAPVIGPDGPFFPAGARRLADGVDTDTAADWAISSFSLPGDNTPTGGGFDGCAPIPLTIPEIQGDGQFSDYQGEVVITEGVVTVDLQGSSELSGFFIQDRFGDGDPATSDGLFVYHRDSWSPSFDPSVGDLVRVQGTIDEYYGQTQMESLDAGTICDTGFQPVATNVFAREFNANAESYEGMYVRFPRQLFVTDTYNQHSYGEVWLGEKGVVEQPTNEYPAGPGSEALAADNMARSVLLDDSSTWSYPDTVPYTGDEGTLRVGDTVNPLVGAINFSYGNYRIQPQDPASVRFVPQNARPGEPITYGNLVVASANVLNYWTTLGGRGASTPEQLAVQTEKLVAELRGTGADIIGLQEIENDSTHTPILTLVDALNAAEGADVWSWIGAHDANVYPIRNEIIYRNDRVETVGDPVTVIDPIFDTIPPGRTDPVGRRPVAQTFEFNGETFTVINNHFKSKGCGGASGDDLDQGDGQSCFNATRVGQAERVLVLVDDLIEDTGDPDVIVIGDLNSYLDEDPVLAFETEMVNLVREWDKDPYSYNYFAPSLSAPWIGRGLLDQALATPSMADQVKRAEVWHINADEPRFLDWYDPDVVAPGPYRASDHDPVIVSLKLK